MANIISPPAGNFTPGAQFSIQTLADVINAAWNKGLDKSTEFDAKITAATAGFLDTASTPKIVPTQVYPIPNVVEPAVTIPAMADTSGIYSEFQTQYLALVQLLSDKFVAFRTSYFNNEQTDFAAAESWLQDALANPNRAIPTAVADALVQEDKDRINADAQRAQDEVLATFASKRMPLPSGAAANAVIEIQQKAQDEIAQSARAVTIKNFEMTYDKAKFAVEKLLGLRQIAMNSAVEYIKAIASGPDLASRLVNIGYDAQSKLISAASQFYGARTEAQKLTYAANQHNADLETEANKANQAAELQMVEDKLKALLTEAQALAQMATALFNNIHAQAGTAYSVNGT